MKKTILIAVILIVIGTGFALTYGPFPADAGTDPVFWNELGFQLTQEGRMVEAQDAFLQAVLLDPSYENARKNLYVSAFQNGDFLTAEEHVRYLLEDGETAERHFDLGQALVMAARSGVVDDPFRTLEEALVHLDTAGDWPHAQENAVIVRTVLNG